MSNKTEIEERIAIVSKQVLNGLTTQEICLKASEKWGVSNRQVTRYIRRCYTLWHKDFEKKRKRNLDYHFAKRRDLYKQAYNKKQWNICLEIVKDEARLTGIYPSEKHDVNLKGELKITNARQKFADRIAHIAARTKENKTT